MRQGLMKEVDMLVCKRGATPSYFFIFIVRLNICVR